MAIDTVLEELKKGLSENSIGVGEKKAKADTLKNKISLIQALKRRKIDEVGRILKSIGCQPNFLIPRMGTMHSPLSLASSMCWEEGVRALLEAGSAQSLALESSQLSAQEKEKLPNQVKNPARSLVSSGNAKLACAILENEINSETGNSKDMIEQAADAAAKKGRVQFELFLSSGLIGKDTKHWVAVAETVLSRGSSDDLKWLVKNQAPRLASRASLSARAWKRAVELDDPSLAVILAKSQIGLGDQSWRMELKGEDFVCDLNKAPSRMIKMAKQGSWSYAKRVENAPPLCAPLALYSAWKGSEKMLRALCQIKKIKDDIFAAPESKELASLINSVEMLKTLAALTGARPIDFVNEMGDTPLHKLLSSRHQVSKSAFEKMAKAFPEWIGMKNKNNLVPIELYSSNMSNYEELLVMQDGIAIKKDTGGRFKKVKKGVARSI